MRNNNTNTHEQKIEKTYLVVHIYMFTLYFRISGKRILEQKVILLNEVCNNNANKTS